MKIIRAYVIMDCWRSTKVGLIKNTGLHFILPYIFNLFTYLKTYFFFFFCPEYFSGPLFINQSFNTILIF